MKHATVLIAALLFLAGTAAAQDAIWVRTWLQGVESPGRAVAASGTDIYVAATAMEANTDILVLKYDADGEVVWDQTVDLDEMEMVVDIAVGADGQPVACTRVDGPEMAAGLVKFTGVGETAWTRRLDRVMPSNIAVGSGNAVYVWASVFDSIPMEAFTLARYGSNGTLDWQKSLRLGEGNQTAGCCADAAGNIIGAGVVMDSLGPQPYVIKFNASGDTVWTRSLADLGVSEVLGVAAGAGDTLVVTGMTGEELKIIRLAGTGDTVWTRTHLTRPSPEAYNNVAMDSEGSVVVPRMGMENRCQLLKLGSDGEIAWEGAIEERGMQFAVCTDSDDRPVTTGVTIEGTMSCLTIKWEGRGGVLEQGGPGAPAGTGLPGSIILDSSARLAFTAPVAGHYRVRLFDNTGALARELHSGRLEPGEHALHAPGLAAGAYTLRIDGPQGTSREKLVQVR